MTKTVRYRILEQAFMSGNKTRRREMTPQPGTYSPLSPYNWVLLILIVKRERQRLPVKVRTIIYIVTIILILLGAYFLVFGLPTSSPVRYEFATVTFGDVENTVSATGTVTPVTTVEVGTQISGTIDTVFVDYNDAVKAGQVLAVLDTTLLKSAVLDADANLSRSEAQLQQAQSDYDRNKSLFDRTMISEADFLPFRVGLKVQEANVKSAQATLARAKRNIDLAVIQSPITGIVIGKNVESGQTVAASLSTPTLFIIAEDLSRMEILTDVDESDIGLIKTDQNVRFEVATYPDKEFAGSVKQVRLQPKTVSNVVTYTVVVEARNDEGFLLPGMTATVDFITEQRTHVLLVPNKALRFQPTAEQLAKLQKSSQPKVQPGGEPQGASPDTSVGSAMGGQQAWAAGGHGRPKDAAVAWYLDSLGQLASAPFRAGLSDGSNTEVVRSRVLVDGLKVIVGTIDESSKQAPATRPGTPGGMRMRPLGF
jgi:HlyD family secretion protein